VRSSLPANSAIHQSHAKRESVLLPSLTSQPPPLPRSMHHSTLCVQAHSWSQTPRQQPPRVLQKSTVLRNYPIRNRGCRRQGQRPSASTCLHHKPWMPSTEKMNRKRTSRPVMYVTLAMQRPTVANRRRIEGTALASFSRRSRRKERRTEEVALDPPGSAAKARVVQGVWSMGG
jgi:hypothetical protein